MGSEMGISDMSFQRNVSFSGGRQIGLGKILIDNLSQNDDERRCSVCSLDCPYISDDTQIYVHVLCMELSRLIVSRHIDFPLFGCSVGLFLSSLRGWGCDILRFLTPKKTSPNVHEGRSYMAPEPVISTYF